MHGAVELIAHEVPAPLAVAYLIAGVLPDLAYEKGFRVCSLDPGACLGDERVRQFICHIQSPSRRSHLKPVRDNTVLAQYELSEALVFFDHFRQILDAPPRPVAVAFVHVKLIPAAVWRVLISVCSFAVRARIIAVSVKVDAVRSRVAEDSVKDDAYASLAGSICKVHEVLISTQRRVDVHIVRGIVAVI